MKIIMKSMCAAMLAAVATSAAADEIQWSRTLDTPKGLNVPPGVPLDILGIALGDSLEEVRAKLGSGVEEQVTTLSLPGPTPIEVRYASGLVLERELEGDARETITVSFSAPSSGSQTIAIDRTLELRDQNNQVRISQLLDALTKRVGSAPDPVDSQSQAILHKYQYDGGARTAAQGRTDCYDYAKTWHDEGALREINPKGTCDVAYDIRFFAGISEDHARSVSFSLYDNERAKANLAADYAFFREYVRQVQEGTGGAVPAL